MVSKGSENIRSIQGGYGYGGIATNNSFAVSGTPTDNISNYIRYIVPNGGGPGENTTGRQTNNNTSLSQINKNQPYHNYFFHNRNSSVQYPYSHRTNNGRQIAGSR
mmetsp:Transcript_9533/g.9113  ORF Transcript_9533/g.9113 Transcript_9533/m.9113 type:complete len:106 (-) Transcript_9533:273-590(-)